MFIYKCLRRWVGLAALAALVGCAHYNVAGKFEDTGQIFTGTVSVVIGDSGTVNVATLDGSVTCTGNSQVTKRPSGFTTIGGQGRASVTCNDGRTFKVDFIQTSESGGHGKGLDNQGNIVMMFFDTSEEGARSRLEVQHLNSLVN
ncbi:MAG: hypothetical protein ACPGNT_05020 [Rhodospirillales bacterium]